ncbi:PulJ/GspJ family protein [Desulfosporosinus lacus]|uniref:Prepilin-type N-terminal cleavage/methylation domain-containing protein n=1 Tax=Desulfosporosinus lacus DSM 15449 TaxID=1121420 RepID=A0A1M5Z116_9FIRM|nr:prepilin-type N-terminal cleavage/methylation domain-containing protein [Desulfosporosinus lacus]SHI17891.1 prepilin-type N-terminal cleavage/methylation domain-containing protein [Desulfosporosinus lacus DSM 15449]
MIENKRCTKNSTQGFTLIEVMIAISIFGLLLLYASQFMRSEIRVYESASEQNEVEQKARVAMMHILDEVRLNNFTFYKSTSNDQGIYRYANAAAAALKDETNSTCLIFVSLGSTPVIPPASAQVFFDNRKGELWHLKNGSRYLIADEISQLSIDEDSTLVKIEISMGENDGSKLFELLTWVRLN